MANYSATLCVWSSHPKDELAKQVFLRQALPMTWDFAETNPFSSAGGTFGVNIEYLRKAVYRLPGSVVGRATQADATRGRVQNHVISTDPPYYDNIGYADLSDFFYAWLRRSIKPVFPDLFSTLAVPKTEELVATPYRHGSKAAAEAFFLDGMTQVVSGLAGQAHPGFPVTIYYAFKQSESRGEAGTASTGWETFLDAVIRAGFAITGTWPMRTELITNLKNKLSALASSIVLICRPRSADAPTETLRELLTALRSELPQALRLLQTGNVAPVDLAQAAIGPGMAVYTRYAKVHTKQQGGRDLSTKPSGSASAPAWSARNTSRFCSGISRTTPAPTQCRSGTTRAEHQGHRSGLPGEHPTVEAIAVSTRMDRGSANQPFKQEIGQLPARVENRHDMDSIDVVSIDNPPRPFDQLSVGKDIHRSHLGNDAAAFRQCGEVRV